MQLKQKIETLVRIALYTVILFYINEAIGSENFVYYPKMSSFSVISGTSCIKY